MSSHFTKKICWYCKTWSTKTKISECELSTVRVSKVLPTLDGHYTVALKAELCLEILWKSLVRKPDIIFGSSESFPPLLHLKKKNLFQKQQEFTWNRKLKILLSAVCFKIIVWCVTSFNVVDRHRYFEKFAASFFKIEDFSALKTVRSTRWRSWLRHWAKSRKVTGSFSVEIVGIFYSGRIMAMG